MSVEIIGDTQESPLFQNMNLMTRDIYFPTNIYTVNKPEFLENVSEVASELLRIAKDHQKLDEIYPVIMTENFYNHPLAADFAAFVGNTSWDILDAEGYDMDRYGIKFSEMWVQEHHRHSLMETHVHGFGSQLTGFYFLEAPENCSRVVIHDARPGKVQSNLPEKNRDQVTGASGMINFPPMPGMLMILPAWLPHSFSRHAADEPIKFVHFNLFAELKPQQQHACMAPVTQVI